MAGSFLLRWGFRSVPHARALVPCRQRAAAAAEPRAASAASAEVATAQQHPTTSTASQAPVVPGNYSNYFSWRSSQQPPAAHPAALFSTNPFRYGNDTLPAPPPAATSTSAAAGWRSPQPISSNLLSSLRSTTSPSWLQRKFPAPLHHTRSIASPTAAAPAPTSAPASAQAHTPATTTPTTTTPTSSREVTLEDVKRVVVAELGKHLRLRLARVKAAELARLPEPAVLQQRVAALRDEFKQQLAATGDKSTTAEAVVSALVQSSLNVLRVPSASDVRLRLEVVSVAAGCGLEAARQLCTRNRGMANLLTLSPQRIRDAFAAFRECVAMERATKEEEDALDVYCRSGKVLYAVPPDTMRQRFNEMGPLFGYGDRKCRSLLYEAPRLLDVAPTRVKAGVDVVKDGLELETWEDAARVATRCPSILSHNLTREHLVPTLRWLKRRLHVNNSALESHTILFSLESAVLEERLLALPALLDIKSDDALRLIQAHPNFLVAPSSTVAQSWSVIKRAARSQAPWSEQLRSASAVSFVSFLGLQSAKLASRFDRVMRLALSPEDLPSFRTVAQSTADKFESLMTDLSSRAKKRSSSEQQPAPPTDARSQLPGGKHRPQPAETHVVKLGSIAADFPTLAAQLQPPSSTP